MEVSLFADIVRELLAKNGKASLPGLGVFEVQHFPASFSDKGFTINPPYSKVVFRQCNPSDMSLVDFYAEKNGNVPRKVAYAALADFSEKLKSSVQSSKSVSFQEFGKLRATPAGDLFFVQDCDFELFPQYAVLEPLSLRNSADVEPSAQLPAEEGLVVIQGQTDECEVATCAVTPARRVNWYIPVLLAVISAVCLFFVLIAVLGRVAPDFLDTFLYSDEQLRILHTSL